MVNQDYIRVILGDDGIYLSQEKMLSVLSELRGSCISVLVALAIANTKGEYPTQMDISEQTGYSTREVCRATKCLRVLGLIPEKTISGYLQSGKIRISNELRWKVWEKDNFTCQICGSRTNLSVDHIYPESAGGKTTLDNLQTLCRTCNSRKGARIIEQYV